MATVYKRTRRKPIPEGATFKTIRGQRVAEWQDGHGRTRRAPLDEDGGGILVEAAHYTVKYLGSDGLWQTEGTKIADRDTAKQYAAMLETSAHKRRTGMVDPADERYLAEGRKPLAKHLADFRANLEARGNTTKHAYETFTQATKLVGLCGAEYPKDLTASGTQEALRSMGDGEDGRSLETLNHYLRAGKSFTRWMRLDKRLRDDPLESLTAYNAATDPRHTRRALSEEEVSWLLAVTENRTFPEHKMIGPDRAMLYRMAFGTGFRRSELRSLTPESFDLGGCPTVAVEAGYSKRRREDTQPIHTSLAARLRAYLVGKPKGQPVFATMPENTARMLRGDLKHARAAWIDAAGDDPQEREAREKSDFLKYIDAAGKVADFHSTRHTFISGLVAGRCSVKTAQELARHSTPSLTIGRYSHTALMDLRGALDALPACDPPEALKSRPVVEEPKPKWYQSGDQASGVFGHNPDAFGRSQGTGHKGLKRA